MLRSTVSEEFFLFEKINSPFLMPLSHSVILDSLNNQFYQKSPSHDIYFLLAFWTSCFFTDSQFMNSSLPHKLRISDFHTSIPWLMEISIRRSLYISFFYLTLIRYCHPLDAESFYARVLQRELWCQDFDHCHLELSYQFFIYWSIAKMSSYIWRATASLFYATSVV
jgi:hypothetical protein